MDKKKILKIKNNFVQFILLFAAVFLLCYFGALFITGLAVEGGMYNRMVAKYFDIAGWLRTSLIVGTKLFISLFNIQTVRTSDYVLRIPGSNSIRIVYSPRQQSKRSRSQSVVAKCSTLKCRSLIAGSQCQSC